MGLSAHFCITESRKPSHLAQEPDHGSHVDQNRSELGVIYEYPLWDSDPDQQKLTASHIGDQTYLATYYDTQSPGARHIIYQGENKGIHDYNITKDSRALSSIPYLHQQSRHC
jgi:hypothetical protein